MENDHVYSSWEFLGRLWYDFFILPNNILNGGTAGVAVALQPLFHIDTVWMTNALTVGLYGVGVIF